MLKNASGLHNLMRNLGGAVGLAAINTVATARVARHTQHLDAQVTWMRAGAMQFLGGLIRAPTAAKGAEAHLAAVRQVATIVQHQALAYNDVLLLLAGTRFIALPLALAKPNTGAVVAHWCSCSKPLPL
jgi:DHA2 family multidrug resistance protein